MVVDVLFDGLQVFYGMVLYGTVWYGMVWYGTVWYGIVQYGTVWLYLASMAALQAKGVVSRAVYREERQGQQLRDILTYSISGLLAKQVGNLKSLSSCHPCFPGLRQSSLL